MSVEITRQVMERYWAADPGDNSMLADDVVFTIMDTGEQHYGPDGIRQMLQDVYHGTFEATGEITNKVISDGHAVAEGFIVGKQLKDFAGVSARGQDVRIPICVSYDVVKGLLARGRVYLATGVLSG